MRGRKPMWTLSLLAVWLVGQMPWVLGLFVMLHGSHETTAMQLQDRVVLVFAHQPAESNPDHRHDDHSVSVSSEDNYVRRATSNGLPLLRSAPVMTFYILAAPEIDRSVAALPSLCANRASPLFALGTIVLMV